MALAAGARGVNEARVVTVGHWYDGFGLMAIVYRMQSDL
jgi:hypothetical protein